MWDCKAMEGEPSNLYIIILICMMTSIHTSYLGLQTRIVTETRAIVSSIRRETKSGFGSIKPSSDGLHLATEDGYTTLEQRLYPVLRNDLGPLISSNHGDLLTEIKDGRGIYKGVVRVPHISLCLDMSLSGI